MENKQIIKIGGITAIILLLFSSVKSYKLARTLYQKWKGAKEKESYNIIKSFWISIGYTNQEAVSFVNSNTPWSAAFISYIMIKSGYKNFPKSKFNTCLASKIQVGDYDYFTLANPSEYSPKVGDIIIKNKPGGTLTFDSFNCGDDSRSDMVTKVSSSKIETIGGDFNNAIVQKVIPTDSQGKILNSSYFAIIKVD